MLPKSDFVNSASTCLNMSELSETSMVWPCASHATLLRSMAFAMDLWRQSFWAVRNVYVGEGTLPPLSYSDVNKPDRRVSGPMKWSCSAMQFCWQKDTAAPSNCSQWYLILILSCRVTSCHCMSLCKLMLRLSKQSCCRSQRFPGRECRNSMK